VRITRSNLSGWILFRTEIFRDFGFAAVHGPAFGRSLPDRVRNAEPGVALRKNFDDFEMTGKSD
jgi:hypothetical protein